jgi:thiamine-phosphate pyrophosphorylase
MIRCYITDRHSLAPGDSLLAAIARNLAQGLDWIQIREKDWSARQVWNFTREALALPNPHGTRILVNARADAALAAGCAGVHLPEGSPAPKLWRSIVPADFLIGVSCHSIEAVRRAEDEGASYVVFGPVFAPISKDSALPPRGLDQLAEAARSVRIPVLALGGIRVENVELCARSGAAGIAGISLFQSKAQTTS